MSPTLLVADGDAELCEIYQSYLNALGYEVETAANGLDCVEKLRRMTPAALVLDRELCWGGGDGVLAWLREDNTRSHIPVVLTTLAVGYSPETAEDLNPPIVKFLRKPFALRTLFESVQAIVANRTRRMDVPISDSYFG
jgi:DNA-binding response OmpR family regulator